MLDEVEMDIVAAEHQKLEETTTELNTTVIQSQETNCDINID